LTHFCLVIPDQPVIRGLNSRNVAHVQTMLAT
jgi:hypothetical protein